MKLIFEKSVPGRRCSILPRCDVEEVQLPQELRRQEAPALLSWDYLCWVRAHPAKDWYCPQYILYGENDSMTDLATIRTYTDRKSTRLNSSHTDIPRMPSSA